MDMRDNAVSIWNYTNSQVASLAEYVLDVDMQQQDDIAIIVEKASIVIQRSQLHIKRHANVS